MDRKTAIQVLMGCAGKECVNATKTECPYADWLGEYEDSYYECTTRLARDVLTLLKEQPTIDAVSVVRCKDCRHWKNDSELFGKCEQWHLVGVYGADWFCADGEREEGR